MGYRIVMNAWGSFGDVYPYLGLAHALRARGHAPVLALPSFYREIVEQEGFAFRPVGPDVDANDHGLIARVMHPTQGPAVVIRELMIPGLRASYEALLEAVDGADLLVSHPITFAAPVVAQQRALPWVSTVLSPLSFFSVWDLPVFPPAPFLVHLGALGPWAGRALGTFARLATRGWADAVYALRAEAGLPRGGNPIFEGQFSEFLTLALFSPVLGPPQPDWPSRARATGFVFYNGPGGLSPRLEAFLDAGPPPVVFTLGSSAVGAAGAFYSESAAAVRQLGCRAVLLTGGLPQNEPGEAASDEMLVVDRAPHQRLFPRASAVVHQGGVGTTAQALRAGTPMLVVPHAHDQPDNAHRVTSLGVARTLRPPRYRAAVVAGEIRALLEQPAYRARATEIGAVVRDERGADAAADAIVGVLDDRGTAPGSPTSAATGGRIPAGTLR